MAFSNNQYIPPGVTTRTLYESPISGGLDNFKLPVFVGEGNEFLYQADLEVARGSASLIDQEIVGEDETGRAVVAVSNAGAVTLGAFDGVLDRFQVRHFPIVSGDGTGTATNSRTDVSVTINGLPIVIRSVAGTTGIVQLSQAPAPGDLVRCDYYYKRTDTQVTDDVSAQVPNRLATVNALSGLYDVAVGGTNVINLHGDILAVDGSVLQAANNVLALTVDSVDYSLTLPPKTNYTMAQIASAITALAAGTLTATTFVNQYGHSALRIQAEGSLAVKEGSANGLLGLLTGQVDNRTVTFYVFNGPIVDGTNGGSVTTDPSRVTVRVAGRQVIPVRVDGANRAVTLAVAPKAGSSVSITYYFNTWQDTYDNLVNFGITGITQCGDVPGGSTYIEGADFILQNDKILWGSAVTAENGATSPGFTAFGEGQVTATLVDNQTFMAECTAQVTQSGGIASESRRDFVLPFQPTLGNGRNTPLGQSLFQTVSNGRIDLPVNRPDVVWAYWGYDPQDALTRGRVEVLKVDGLVITLSETVPVGASVYASFYYNTLTDETYTLTVQNPGVSGVGTYTIQNSGTEAVLAATYSTATKSAALTGVTIEFPSGSELTPDFRFEVPEDTGSFLGPIEEIATVTFASRVASLARYTFPGSGPYEFIPGKSDHLAITAHSAVMVGAAGINLSSPSAVTAHVGGYFGCVVGDEIVYEGGVATAPGQGYDLSGEEFNLELDGVDVAVKTGVVAGASVSDVVFAVNQAVAGHQDAVDGAQVANDTTVVLAPASTIGTDASFDGYYNGWKIVIGGTATVAGVRGEARTITAFDAASSTVTVSPVFSGNVTAADDYYIYNPETRATLVGTTRFDGPVVIALNKFDTLKLVYRGSFTGTSTAQTLTLVPGTYSTPDALAAQVQTQLDAMAAALVGGNAKWNGLKVECTANGDGQLQFQLQLPGQDAAGYLQFIGSVVATDFAILAGLDTSIVGSGEATGQTTLIQGPVAWAKTNTGGGIDRKYDRLLIRNRILPGGASGNMAADTFVAQGNVVVKSSSAVAGLTVGMASVAGSAATVHPATLAGRISLLNGQDAVSKEPTVTFYDGTGLRAANEVLNFELDGYPISVNFGGSALGTAVNLGPATGTNNGTILDTIIEAIGTLPGTPFGAPAAVFAAKLVRQEGIGIRLTSSRTDTLSRVVVTGGSAAQILGFVAGQTSLRTTTTAGQVAAALMSDVETTFSSWALDPSSSDAGHFGNVAVATVVTDDSGAEYLYIQDLPALNTGLGTVSNISVHDTAGDVANALRTTTGLNALDGDGGVGDPALSGYYVTSNVPNGSGSKNNSMLSTTGVGQDGIVGQTYRDLVTGLTFTILPRGWQTDPNGPWVAYPSVNASFRVSVSGTLVTDANLSNNALPGVELTVANTSGAAVGDTAIVTTHERGGQEPRVGDSYYISYVYRKQDFSTTFFSKMSTIEKTYGSVSPDNPVSLAAYLAILNGAVVVGIKQVPREEGLDRASLPTYRDAIDELEGVLPGQIKPDIITLMRGDSTDLYQYLKRSCEIQSSVKYRAERTAINGVSAGTTPEAVGTLAQALKHGRMRLVYPDMATLDIQDAQGGVKEYLVDGCYLAAALSGSVVSPNLDVATPWTGRRLVGFTQLARQLNAVQQNQVAVKGVTVLEDRSPYLRVRDGLTTDVSDPFFKLPTIILIQDEVQRQARNILEPFIGMKFLPGILSQIEGRLAMMLKSLVAAQIITAYTGVKARISPLDPTTCEVEAWYSPVFPLKYINVTFHVRNSLS